jgi:hypothetical protein
MLDNVINVDSIFNITDENIYEIKITYYCFKSKEKIMEKKKKTIFQNAISF